MRELSLHILDLAQNCVAAAAKNIHLTVNEDEQGFFVITVADDGRGMSEELVRQVRDPFVTSRKTRKVGMGIPFMDMVAQQCGGHVDIKSSLGQGTEIKAYFEKDNIDRPPLGDLASSIKVLLVGAPEIDVVLDYIRPPRSLHFATKAVREILGPTADFTNPAVYQWVEEYLRQEIARVQGKEDVG